MQRSLCVVQVAATQFRCTGCYCSSHYDAICPLGPRDRWHGRSLYHLGNVVHYENLLDMPILDGPRARPKVCTFTTRKLADTNQARPSALLNVWSSIWTFLKNLRPSLKRIARRRRGLRRVATTSSLLTIWLSNMLLISPRSSIISHLHLREGRGLVFSEGLAVASRL